MGKAYILILPLLLWLGGCTIHHDLTDDYDKYLASQRAQTEWPTTEAFHRYALTPLTEKNHFELHIGAHSWEVDPARIIDATMASKDIQNAFGPMAKSMQLENSDQPLMIFHLQWYSFDNFAAHIVLKASLVEHGEERFRKTYSGSGSDQYSKIYWGAGLAMRNAIQESTKQALDAILRQLAVDLNAMPAQANTAAARQMQQP